MAKVVVVTGLDGSGKSTFFDRLQQVELESLGIFNIPEMNLEAFKEKAQLHQAGRFINRLGELSSELKQPFVKGIALFMAMHYFGDMLQFLEASGKSVIFCERHPRIDAAIYAGFYAAVFAPAAIDPKIIELLDREHATDLKALENRLGEQWLRPVGSPAENICQMIYALFYGKRDQMQRWLPDLFQVELPEEVYFLDAAPEVLMQRINRRNFKEPHEQLKTLTAFRGAYQRLFRQLEKESNCRIELINAENFDELDAFTAKVSGELLDPSYS